MIIYALAFLLAASTLSASWRVTRLCLGKSLRVIGLFSSRSYANELLIRLVVCYDLLSNHFFGQYQLFCVLSFDLEKKNNNNNNKNFVWKTSINHRVQAGLSGHWLGVLVKSTTVLVFTKCS